MPKIQKFLFIALTIFIIIFPIWYFAMGPSESLPGAAYNKAENAIWLEHEWVEKNRTTAQIGALVSNFGAHKIKYVFVHSGPIEPDGTIPPQRYSRAVEFLKTARMYGDKIQYLAWIGQVRSKLNLAEPEVRFRLVKTSRILAEEIGFDGIHYDIEPIYEKDSDIEALLESTKTAIGNAKILSVAVNEMMPDLSRRIFKLWAKTAAPLTEETFVNIARHVDQIAVMTYENSLHSPWLYRYFLKNEIIWLTRAIDEPKILIGIPTYEKGIDPNAENIENGLAGIIAGLQNTRSNKESFLGVAIYLNKETSKEEWGTYDKLWIR
ncbi:hypothetical protein HZA39_02945 [Candidatus Peregrinibacteria bacterium]|nr:hypothetical protein [Candidatus Peregrinibacteria bacterium]